MKAKLVCLACILIAVGPPFMGGSTASRAGLSSVTAKPGARRGDYMTALSDWRWVDDKWTGDDQPFAAARQSIDGMFAAGVDTSSLVAKYKLVAGAHPDDALAQYNWAYANFRQLQIPHANQVSPDSNYEVIGALAAAVQPHVYDYDRLRLLYEPDAPQERRLCERLLRNDASDFLVNSIYAFILSESKSKVDDDKAVSIEDGIVASGQYSPTCLSGRSASGPKEKESRLAAGRHFYS